MSSPPPIGPRSADLLYRLQALPRLTIPVVALVLLLVGLFASPAVAVPALVLLLAFVVWLALLSWPTQNNGGRLLRGLVIGILAGALISRLVALIG